jgi:hypothetical protein
MTARTAVAAIGEIQTGIRIYPNPVKDHVTVQCGAGAQIVVHDVMGRVIYTARSKGSAHVVDMSRVGQGVYFVEVKEGAEVVTKKIVKE